jgi:myo-inositol-1(or 4)-monophosphatase
MSAANDIPACDLLEHAVIAARTGGAYAASRLERRGDVITLSHHDVKLQLDVETQAEIESYLHGACPDHHFFGEESDRHEVKSGYTWIVDPIDGTMNYFRGIPYWNCSVAVAKDGRIVAGAVYAPMQDEMFTATVDGPAQCNGKEIRVSDVASLQESIIITAGLARLYDREEERLNSFLRLITSVSKFRILGAAALDLCYVACGRADALYEYRLNIWDTAAGGLIAERAGAITRKFDEESDVTSAYLVANPHLFERLATELGI